MAQGHAVEDTLVRIGRAVLALSLLLVSLAGPLRADPAQVVDTWYRLTLELVRHTPTYSPPVAARAFGYLGVIAWEAQLNADRPTLAGQLNALAPPPAAPAGTDPALVLHAALAAGVEALFSNTGPTGQRAMAAMDDRLGARLAEAVAPDIADRSRAHGRAIAAHVLDWAATDGGAVVENMGFPLEWTLGDQPGAWRPTSLIVQQQAPLLPEWGQNRPMAMPAGDACPLPPPPPYDTAPGSALRTEAEEVLAISRGLTAEQEVIARFWSDDPMLSPTPPGHWIRIALDILRDQGADAPRRAEVLMRLGVAANDAFIGCWDEKYRHDFLRPVTYIRAVLDPGWTPLLITPPFPEYPSGHSTLSGASAAVLTAAFGEPFAFVDETHVEDGFAPRPFPSFAAAAEEAAMSRVYGGIHFRSAATWGLRQGACIGAHAVALRTAP